MDASAAQQKIQEMVRRIVAGFRPYKILLFGSFATGTAGPHSDADLLIIMPLTDSRRKTRIRIRSALHGMGLAKDIVVATPDEVERDRDVTGALVRSALREGKVLYERPAA